MQETFLIREDNRHENSQSETTEYHFENIKGIFIFKNGRTLCLSKFSNFTEEINFLITTFPSAYNKWRRKINGDWRKLLDNITSDNNELKQLYDRNMFADFYYFLREKYSIIYITPSEGKQWWEKDSSQTSDQKKTIGNIRETHRSFAYKQLLSKVTPDFSFEALHQKTREDSNSGLKGNFWIDPSGNVYRTEGNHDDLPTQHELAWDDLYLFYQWIPFDYGVAIAIIQGEGKYSHHPEKQRMTLWHLAHHLRGEQNTKISENDLNTLKRKLDLV